MTPRGAGTDEAPKDRDGLPPDGGEETRTSDDCAHDLDAYIYPSDVGVIGTANDGEDVVFTLALPCPKRGRAGGRGPERDDH
ncbi:MAG: hypothetical protein V5A61_06855 [Haloarculaceae archaeon]